MSELWGGHARGALAVTAAADGLHLSADERADMPESNMPAARAGTGDMSVYPKHVELDWTEMKEAASRGVTRQIQNLQKDRKTTHGADPLKAWQQHVEGCLGEQALAKHLGLYCGGVGTIFGLDVGGHEVRTTSSARGRLIVHKGDRDDARFYHIVGAMGVYTIEGWMLGRDAKREEWWQDPTGMGRPAFFVPNAKLERSE